jgi:hypothetical protein
MKLKQLSDPISIKDKYIIKKLSIIIRIIYNSILKFIYTKKINAKNFHSFLNNKKKNITKMQK